MEPVSAGQRPAGPGGTQLLQVAGEQRRALADVESKGIKRPGVAARADAMRFAEIGLARMRGRPAATGSYGDGSLRDLIAAFDVHVGTPSDVIASLQEDRTLAHATDLAVQVHPVDPPHPFILRSTELMAELVAPALGWTRDVAAMRRVA